MSKGQKSHLGLHKTSTETQPNEDLKESSPSVNSLLLWNQYFEKELQTLHQINPCKALKSLSFNLRKV